jgi:osmotically-inducible protein OsmY
VNTASPNKSKHQDIEISTSLKKINNTDLANEATEIAAAVRKKEEAESPLSYFKNEIKVSDNSIDRRLANQVKTN